MHVKLSILVDEQHANRCFSHSTIPKIGSGDIMSYDVIRVIPPLSKVKTQMDRGPDDLGFSVLSI